MPRLSQTSVCQAMCVCARGGDRRRAGGTTRAEAPRALGHQPQRQQHQGGDAAAAGAVAEGIGRNSKASTRLPERRRNLTQRRLRDLASVIRKLPELSQEPWFCLLARCWGRGAVRAWQSRRLVIFSFSYTSVLCNLGKSKVLKGVCS